MSNRILARKTFFALLVVMPCMSAALSKDVPKLKEPSGTSISIPVFETKTLRIGKRTITVEVAETDAQRAHGLMHRESLPENQGMLFIFESERPLGFWMMNTLIPLSIGFFDSKKTLVDVKEMVPAAIGDLQPPVYRSSKPARYALEMPKGWFERNNIKPGATFEFTQDLRRSTDKTSR